MADVLRLVTIDPVGRPRVLVDLNVVGGIMRLRDTFRVTPGQRAEHATRAGTGRHAGAQVNSVEEANATVGASFHIKGQGSAAASAALLERLLGDAARVSGRDPLYLEWSPGSLTRAVYWRLRGPATVTPNYAARMFASANAVQLDASWPAAPLAEGLPMDLAEDFRPPPDAEGWDVAGVKVINDIRNPSGRGPAGAIFLTSTNGTAVNPISQVADGRPGALLVDSYEVGSSSSIPAGGHLDLVESLTTLNGGHPCQPGDRIYITAWLKHTGLAAGAVRAYVEFVDAGNNLLTATVLNNGDIAAGAPGTWLNPFRESIAPANAVGYRARFAVTYAGGNAAAVVLRVDDMLCTRHPSYAGAYFDGDTDLGRWEAVANNSRSVLLAESKLADYTVTTAGVFVRSSAAAGERGMYATTSTAVLNHTGRGYGLRDGAWSLRFRSGAAFAANWHMSAGRSRINLDGEAIVFARITDDGAATHTLALIQRINGTQTSLAALTVTALAGGQVYTVRLVVQGNAARAELWTAPNDPRRGGKPTSVTAWVTLTAEAAGASDAADLSGDRTATWHGYYQMSQPAAFDAAAITLLEEPYTFADVPTPDELPILDVPGNAPALASLRIHKVRGSSLNAKHLFGLIGWRARRRNRELGLTYNGSGNAALDGWSNNLGGTSGTGTAISWLATGGPDNGGRVQLSAPATLNSGAGHTVWKRFHRGRVYTIEYWLYVASGTWQIGAWFDSATEVKVHQSGLTGPAQWVRYRQTVVMDGDRSRLDFIARLNAASAGTAYLAGVRVWEGTDADAPAPREASEAGTGAVPAFGFIPAAGGSWGTAPYLAEVTDTTSPTGTGVAFTAPAGNFVTINYRIDPGAVPRLLDELGNQDIEVWLLAKAARDYVVGVSLSYLHEGAAAYSGTREFGLTRRTPTPPTGAAASIIPVQWRLGTIPFEVDELRRGNRITLGIQLDQTGGTFTLHGLVLVPSRQRMASPSGKYNDASYPTFFQGVDTLREGKIIEANGRGSMIVETTGTPVPDTSVAGNTLDLEPGDNELLLWLNQKVPDSPDGEYRDIVGATIQTGPQLVDGVHVRVTPRYRLMRPA
jgi:hypothetical protein